MPNKATTKTTATSSNPKSSNYVPKTTTSSTSSSKTTSTPVDTRAAAAAAARAAAAQTAAKTDTLHAQTSPAFGGPTYTPSSTSGSKNTTASSNGLSVSEYRDDIKAAVAEAKTNAATKSAAQAVAAAAAAAAKAAADKKIADQNQADADMNATNNNADNGKTRPGGSNGSGGSSGYDPNTAALQQQLNGAGASIAVDGIWGPETQAAYDAYINNIYNYGGGGGGSGWSGGGGNGGGNGEYPISQLSAVMGALLPGYINPIGSPELENLHMGDRYDLEYDYDNILNILDNATKNKYNELWNQYSQTENAYYNQNLADQSATLDNIKRAQAAATMSGASKGMQAAQMLSSILTGQQINAGNQLELANVRNNTALSEQTELAENKNTALTTSNAVKQAIAGLDETKYGYDAQMRIGDQDYNAAIANAIGTILAQGVYAGTLDISDYEALLNSLYPQP